jgi:hypothetical protein
MARWIARIMALTVLAPWAGCRLPGYVAPQPALDGNARIEYLLRVPQEVLPPEHSLFAELNAMPAAIREALELPPAGQNVRVYLFEDRDQYRSFLDDVYPHLPDRRAYFVSVDGELAVYAYWSEQTRADLRHELTHAVMHASLGEVPLWLDEGLAEYFEVPADRNGFNSAHVAMLAQSMAEGWQPDLARLETYTEVSDMNRRDYAEAWAWVHWLLSGPPERNDLLVGYLQSPLDGTTRLGPQIAGVVKDPAAALVEHLGGLTTPASN